MSDTPPSRSDLVKAGLQRAREAGKRLGRRPNASDDEIRDMIARGVSHKTIRLTLRVKPKRVADIKRSMMNEHFEMLSLITRRCVAGILLDRAGKYENTHPFLGHDFKIDAAIARRQAEIILATPDNEPLPDIWGDDDNGH